MITVYRFNDRIAISFEGQKTQYVHPDQAKLLAEQLILITNEIKKIDFKNSSISTIYIGE